MKYLRNLLKKNKLDAVLISSNPNIVHLTGYSGFSTEEREAFLFITKNRQYILTDFRYSEGVKKNIPHFELVEISSQKNHKKVIKDLLIKHRIKNLGFEGNDLTFLEHKSLKKDFNNIYHLSLYDLRLTKTPDEISNIEKACVLGDKVFKHILKYIKPGVSEKEIAFEIEMFVKKQNADLSFSPIVAFGHNSATPHHLTSDRRLATSDMLVLLDFGVKYNNFCSDMTRTVFLGEPNEKLKKMYQTVLDAQKLAISRCHAVRQLTDSASQSKEIPKQVRDDNVIDSCEVDRVARDHIISQGYPTIPHSTGHGIGIQVHEAPNLSPNSKDILKNGMVFSVEPGIYIPGFAGIRIEDLVVLEDHGPKILTRSPKVLTQI